MDIFDQINCCENYTIYNKQQQQRLCHGSRTNHVLNAKTWEFVSLPFILTVLFFFFGQTVDHLTGKTEEKAMRNVTATMRNNNDYDDDDGDGDNNKKEKNNARSHGHLNIGLGKCCVKHNFELACLFLSFVLFFFSSVFHLSRAIDSMAFLIFPFHSEFKLEF